MSNVLVCHGNSITDGSFATVHIYTYPEQLQALLDSHDPSNWTVFNEGTGGHRTPQLTSEFAAVVDVHAGAGENIVIVMEGGNDLKNTPSTVPQALQNMADYYAAASLAGWTVWVCTATPRTEAINSSITTFNAALRANPELYGDALIDMAAADNMSDPSNLTYYDADGTHLKNAGFTSLALQALDQAIPGAKAQAALDILDYQRFLARLMTGLISGTALVVTRPSAPGGPLRFTLT
jgi:lysophospholipase L1-like esterase